MIGDVLFPLLFSSFFFQFQSCFIDLCDIGSGTAEQLAGINLVDSQCDKLDDSGSQRIFHRKDKTKQPKPKPTKNPVMIYPSSTPTPFTYSLL